MGNARASLVIVLFAKVVFGVVGTKYLPILGSSTASSIIVVDLNVGGKPQQKFVGRDDDPFTAAKNICSQLYCKPKFQNILEQHIFDKQQSSRASASLPTLVKDLETASFEVDELENSTFWAEQLLSLQGCLRNFPMQFLKCEVIQFLMFMGNHELAKSEFSWLADNVSSKWLDLALAESFVGTPNLMTIGKSEANALQYETSSNLLHHVYSLARFTTATQLNINRMEIIVEFGGGYGSFARLAFQAGFNGKYVIHDLNPFSILQKHYLFSVGVPVRELEDWDKYTNGVWFTSSLRDFESLKLNSPGVQKNKNTMLVGMFSLSEVSVELREKFFSLGPASFHNYLFLVQPSWRENTVALNLEWFSKFMLVERGDLSWHTWADYGTNDDRFICGSWNRAGAVQTYPQFYPGEKMPER